MLDDPGDEDTWCLLMNCRGRYGELEGNGVEESTGSRSQNILLLIVIIVYLYLGFLLLNRVCVCMLHAACFSSSYPAGSFFSGSEHMWVFHLVFLFWFG